MVSRGGIVTAFLMTGGAKRARERRARQVSGSRKRSGTSCWLLFPL